GSLLQPVVAVLLAGVGQDRGDASVGPPGEQMLDRIADAAGVGELGSAAEAVEGQDLRDRDFIGMTRAGGAAGDGDALVFFLRLLPAREEAISLSAVASASATTFGFAGGVVVILDVPAFSEIDELGFLAGPASGHLRRTPRFCHRTRSESRNITRPATGFHERRPAIRSVRNDRVLIPSIFAASASV